MNFLQKLGTRWNISLFHYRNHGADFGRVLVGMQVAPAESADLDAFFADLDYTHTDETRNAALKMFL
jgi:threonine dehydratase